MKFSEIYKQDKKIISFEFFPPKKKEKLGATKELIKELSTLGPDFMTVTYGAGGSTRGFTKELVSYIHSEVNLPAVAHLTCVSHTLDDINFVLDDLKQSGISNVLALRGDPPKGETSFEAVDGGFSCARDLTSHIKDRKDFSIAVAGYPESHLEAKSAEQDLEYLKEKVDAGAEVILTQLFFDVGLYFDFCKRAKAIGINVPIVPGILPISSKSQVKKFTTLCGASVPSELEKQLSSLQDEDVVDFGTEYAIKMCKDLLEGGAPGLHIYTLNKWQQTGPIVKSLNL